MLLLITAAFFLKRYGTQAVPNPSDGCHSRTVLDILWSCLATTFACTWVSVHPNVPFKGEGEWTLRFRRVFLMLFSILAPEFMIMWAFKQWRGAVIIREAVNEASRGAYPNPNNFRQNPWSTTHGQFLQMGGFRLETTARENFYWGGLSDCGLRRKDFITYLGFDGGDAVAALGITTREHFDTNFRHCRNLIPYESHFRHEISRESWSEHISEDDAQRMDSDNLIWEGVLTIDALKQLLSENLITFPAITEDEINDKSKGDALSKGIALLQLTWFIVQIITRAVQGLAITELELTTAALAGLNSVMYVFWWSKPRDVRFPVVIRTKGVEELLAKRHPEDVAWSFLDQEFDIRKHLWASMATWIKVLFGAPCYFVVSLPSQLISILMRSVEHVKTLPRRLTFIFSRDRSLLLRTRKPTTRANEGEMLHAVDDEPPRKSEKSTKRYALTMFHCAKLATKSAVIPFFCLVYIIDVVLFIPIEKILKSDADDSISEYFFSGVGGFDVDTENKIFSMIFYSENAGVKPLLSASSIAGALFGAVHCLAWHFSFPSHAEQILWRTASLGIVGSCVVTFLTVLCVDLIRELGIVLGLPCLAPAGLATLVYPVARITLLVLAITSLRSPPLSALDTVSWVEFFPHI